MRLHIAVAIGSLVVGVSCGGDGTEPVPRDPIEGTFRLATINDLPVPTLIGIGPRPNASFISPGDSILYAADQFTFVAGDDSSGTLTRSRNWIYRYRPTRADTTTLDAGTGRWVHRGDVYVVTYSGLTSTLVPESSSNAFTISYGSNALFPTGQTGRYVRAAK